MQTIACLHAVTVTKSAVHRRTESFSNRNQVLFSICPNCYVYERDLKISYSMDLSVNANSINTSTKSLHLQLRCSLCNSFNISSNLNNSENINNGLVKIQFLNSLLLNFSLIFDVENKNSKEFEIFMSMYDSNNETLYNETVQKVGYIIWLMI